MIVAFTKDIPVEIEFCPVTSEPSCNDDNNILGQISVVGRSGDKSLLDLTTRIDLSEFHLCDCT